MDLREVDVGSQLACGNTVKGQGTILVRKVRDYGKDTKKKEKRKKQLQLFSPEAATPC